MFVGFLAGASLGLLLGGLVGLSLTPVVAGVVTAVTAAVSGFLAFDRDWSTATLWRVTGLGAGAVAGVALGVMARTHERLAPSPQRAVAAITAAGFAPEEARAIVAHQRYGLLLGLAAPASGPAVAPAPGSATPQTSGLFFGKATSVCQRLVTITAPDEVAGILRAAGGQASRLAPLVAERALTVAGARGLLCEP
jgi:hypothetical protein